MVLSALHLQLTPAPKSAAHWQPKSPNLLKMTYDTRWAGKAVWHAFGGHWNACDCPRPSQPKKLSQVSSIKAVPTAPQPPLSLSSTIPTPRRHSTSQSTGIYPSLQDCSRGRSIHSRPGLCFLLLAPYTTTPGILCYHLTIHHFLTWLHPSILPLFDV